MKDSEGEGEDGVEEGDDDEEDKEGEGVGDDGCNDEIERWKEEMKWMIGDGMKGRQTLNCFHLSNP